MSVIFYEDVHGFFQDVILHFKLPDPLLQVSLVLVFDSFLN
ncbi:hypothetical protein [Paenibacillus agricola]|nr:hypothetical protein [Paenibacillus agricola]